MKQKPKADCNLLEEYIFGKEESQKKAERLDRSVKARLHRQDVREIKDKRSRKEE